VIKKMINEKSKYCIALLKEAGVNNPEKYISIFDSMKLTDKLGAIEYVRNANGSIKKLRFGFFNTLYFSSIDKENNY
jgi:hypothetical protein